MTTTTVDTRAPSGAWVRVQWNDGSSLADRVAGVRFVGGNYGRGFQIGTRGNHDFATTYFVAASVKKRLVVGNREVIVSEANDGSSTIVSLLGKHHELMTVFSGPAPTDVNLTGLFSVLDIDDQPEGMRVVPKKSTLLSVASEHVLATVENRGSVNVPSPDRGRDLLPKARGAKTASGEVWRSRLPGVAANATGVENFAFTMGFSKAVAEVHLDALEEVPDAELLGWLDGINVEWSGR
ncbi:hypothetical protein QLQ12_32775 [Actinoplanes sp. NEAU-A12]|uniref:Uncharacterized protein n=1 Tax=Actinoplanes sandaracinus TaxID=3045177 RepID=A0ABT6WUK5_9ACTN|nr:hypothetical protein [Actinoplanes sandaracinus]MDI6103394.1 hypothetical protein [Actinoplanes sandaracinus]